MTVEAPHASGQQLPLDGRRVVVTRAVEQADELADKLVIAGATVISMPAIAIADPADGGAALNEALGRLDEFAWIIVTSPNGARRLCAALAATVDTRSTNSPGLLPEALKVAAIGPGTAEALSSGGVRIDLVPSQFVAESMAEEFPSPTDDDRGTGAGTAATPGDSPSQRVLLVRAQVARDVIPERLSQMGWQVDIVEAYRTVPATFERSQIEALREADAITFASASAVRNVISAVGAAELGSVAIVTIGPITSAQVAAHGLEVAGEADPHTIDGLVESVISTLSSDGQRDDTLP